MGEKAERVWLLLSLLAGIAVVAGCCRVEVGVVPPTLLSEGAGGPAPAPTARPTPGPSPTPVPTLCARARVSGQTCAPWIDVTLSSCCPEWTAVTTADEVGAFEFDNVTAGEYTVSAGGRSRQIQLNHCDSQVSVDLCPPPTHPPLVH